MDKYLSLLKTYLCFIKYDSHNIYQKCLFLFKYSQQIFYFVLKNPDLKQIRLCDGKWFEYTGSHLNLFLDHYYDHVRYLSKYKQKLQVVVDIGASFGAYSTIIRLINDQSKIYAVEMANSTYLNLKSNSENRSIHISNYAVGDRNGKTTYHIKPEFPEGASIKPLVGANTYRINQITLDSFVTKNSIKHISLLKIDIEGFEVKALKSGRKTLSISDILVVETGFEAENLNQVLNIAKTFGFTLCDLGSINYDGMKAKIDSADLIFRKKGYEI